LIIGIIYHSFNAVYIERLMSARCKRQPLACTNDLTEICNVASVDGFGYIRTFENGYAFNVNTGTDYYRYCSITWAVNNPLAAFEGQGRASRPPYDREHWRANVPQRYHL